jgi:hypothetical protein
MASELARTLAISGEEAADKLLNLSPYETKVPHSVVINVCNFQNSMLKVTWFLLCSFVFAEGFFVQFLPVCTGNSADEQYAHNQFFFYLRYILKNFYLKI